MICLFLDTTDNGTRVICVVELLLPDEDHIKKIGKKKWLQLLSNNKLKHCWPIILTISSL